MQENEKQDTAVEQLQQPVQQQEETAASQPQQEEPVEPAAPSADERVMKALTARLEADLAALPDEDKAFFDALRKVLPEDPILHLDVMTALLASGKIGGKAAVTSVGAVPPSPQLQPASVGAAWDAADAAFIGSR